MLNDFQWLAVSSLPLHHSSGPQSWWHSRIARSVLKASQRCQLLFKEILVWLEMTIQSGCFKNLHRQFPCVARAENHCSRIRELELRGRGRKSCFLGEKRKRQKLAYTVVTMLNLCGLKEKKFTSFFQAHWDIIDIPHSKCKVCSKMTHIYHVVIAAVSLVSIHHLVVIQFFIASW